VTSSTILFGADVRAFAPLVQRTAQYAIQVTHPPPRPGIKREDETNPSVAAVIASQDGTQTTFKHEVRQQTGRQEVIQDLEQMVNKLLRKYAAARL
jgi:hypothetical protein